MSNRTYKSCFLTEEGRNKLNDALKQLNLSDCTKAKLQEITGQDSKTITKIHNQLYNLQKIEPVNQQTIQTFAKGIQNYATLKGVDSLEIFDLDEEIDYKPRSTILSPSPKINTHEAPKAIPNASSESIYIERPPIERECYQEIIKEGALIRIKGSEKMGKTRLINQIIQLARKNAYQTAHLDLLLPEAEIMEDSSRFLRWLCKRVSRKLKLEDSVDRYWGQLTPNTDCTDYFEEAILAHLNTPLVLGLDNIEKLFGKGSAIDFFGMIRTWWGKGVRKEDNWHQIRLILSYSTEELSELPIDLSPFNVGKEIKLPDFTLDQIMNLMACYGLSLEQTEIKPLISLVNGHPYLVDEVLGYLTTHPTINLKELLEKAHTEEGIYCSHLQHYWSRLGKYPELFPILEEIVRSDEAIAIAPKAQSILEKMGLIAKEGNKVKPRCQLYRLYFQERLKTLQ